MKKSASYILVAILFTLIGIAGGFRLKNPILAACASAGAKAAMVTSDEIRAVDDSDAKLTSPLLECAELPESVSDATIEKEKVATEHLIDAATKSEEITYASVYFRDLNNGPWFGINEGDKFFPASLLKLPLAMSIYDHSEDDPTYLSKKIVYKPDPSVTSQLQPYGKQGELKAGKYYSVQSLLDTMLKESNNEAASSLASFVGPSVLNGVYHDLGLALPISGEDYSISTHKYAGFFRILYNATYVDRVASEKILKTLTDAAFTDGLVAGVPASMTVSHKFGTRGLSGGQVQLHDCGIIYAPKKPYILCVMTQGSDFTKLASFIRDVSKTVYAGVVSANN